MQAPELVAVDWGTTNLRAYAIAASGAIIDRIESPRGILSVAAGGFPNVLAEQLGRWLPLSTDCPVMIAGMAGSRQGWREAPYVECPASVESVAGAVMHFKAEAIGDLLLVPGLSCRGPDGHPDVMRGEETQIFGTTDNETQTICLPGTHSKWVYCQGGSVGSFQTYMTGEMFDVTAKHSILARTTSDGSLDYAEFLRGVLQASSGALLHHLFTVRTRGLVDGLSGDRQRWFLSGLFVGSELSSALRGLPDTWTVRIVGSPALTSLYASGLAALGRKCEVVDGASAFAQGARRLFRLWRTPHKGD